MRSRRDRRQEPDLDAALEAVSDRTRRRVLSALLERREVVVPDDVHTGRRDRQSLHAELYHRHLPRMRAEGFVEWDPETHRVSRGPDFDDVRLLLEQLDERQDEPTGFGRDR